MATDPNAENIATIRQRTSGCAWMTDADLTTMLGEVQAHDDEGNAPGDTGYTPTPDLWAISAMVLEQYQINGLLDKTANAQQITAGDNRVQYQGSNWQALDRVIQRYWRRADPLNREEYLQPRMSSFRVLPSHRPQLLRRWIGVYPVVNGYPGAELAAGDQSLEEQMFQDFAPLMIEERDL